MKARLSWQPRWPCFAIGFYKERKRYSFVLIVWAIVFSVGS